VIDEQAKEAGENSSEGRKEGGQENDKEGQEIPESRSLWYATNLVLFITLP